jgi:hypothetical protein
METHEIVMDNDIVLLKKFPQIDEFLPLSSVWSAFSAAASPGTSNQGSSSTTPTPAI